MKAIKKISVLGIMTLFLLVLVTSSSLATPLAQLTASQQRDRRHPPNPSPFDDMYRIMKDHFLSFIYHMKDAGFSQGDVLYTTWSVNNTATRKVFVNKELNLTRQRSNLVLNRANILYNKTQIINDTLNDALATARDVWNSTEFQNNTQVNKTTFNGSFLRFWLAFSTYYVSTSDNPPSAQGFINYYLATTREDMLRLYGQWVEDITNVPARIWHDTFTPISQDLLNRTDHVATMRVAAKYMELWHQEISTHDAINFYKRIFVNVTIATEIDGKALATFWDPDKSVIDTIEKIKNNETVDHQPFSGDEILTTLMVVLLKETIEGRVEQEHDIRYDNGDSVQVLLRLLRIAEINPNAIRFITRVLGVDLSIFREFLGPSREVYDTEQSGPKVLFNAKFRLSQLQIRNLTLARVGNNVVIRNFAFHLAEHQALSPIIFNDTNQNGYLDVASEIVTDKNGDRLRPIISEEALYRVDLLNIGDKAYSGPEIQNDEITVGLDFGNLDVALVPFARPSDVTAFNKSYQVSRQTVDDFQLKFHFRVNHTARRADWKFDYIYGEWSDKDVLKGLSFNQMIFTTVSDHERRRIYRVVDDANDTIDNNHNSTRFRRFRITPSTDEDFVEVDLDTIPYEWNNSGSMSETAYGQLLPLNFGERLFGYVASDGEALRGIIAHSAKNTYLYSISYPKFSGEEIAHDPTFSVVAHESSAVSESSGTGQETQAPIPGFEVTLALIGTSILAIISISRKKRHKQ